MIFSSIFSMSLSFGLGNFRFNSMILSLTCGSKTVLAFNSISVQNSFSESTSNLLDLKAMKIDADKDRKIVPKIKMAKNLIFLLTLSNIYGLVPNSMKFVKLFETKFEMKTILLCLHWWFVTKTSVCRF